jgi:hypothetical protein
LTAKLTEVHEAIAAVRDDDRSFGEDDRRRLAELEQRLQFALESY